MVQAIASSVSQSAISTGAVTASLEAQLVRYQQQLSDCVNCDSSKTAAGKATIQAISVKISDVRERIDKVTEVNLKGKTVQPAAGTATTASVPKNQTEQNPAPRQAVTTVGSVVDVFA